MSKPVYIAGVGLTKVDLTGRVFGSVFDLFAQAYERALEDSAVRSFGALQLGIMDSEEFENRANIAAKVADRLALTGIPAIRTETASSTGASAFHEAAYKVASGQVESVLVLAGERMKNVTTDVATSIMSKTVDPVERRFGFTMPGLIALITQAWLQKRGLSGPAVGELLAKLMHRAHAFGCENPLAAFHGRPEPISAYFDPVRNKPVATPLMRKDCSPICDGAAAVILTSRPQPVRVAGLGSATETSSILDRRELASLEATRRAARIAYWQAGVADPRRLEGLVVEAHDAFNSLLPIDLCDLGLRDEASVLAHLCGDGEPYSHPGGGPKGCLPVNLSGGLKARGHPVGGTGLFQIAEIFLQLTERFPNPRAQMASPRIGLAHSIGGPGNNVYVTLLERNDSRRLREETPPPRMAFGAGDRRRVAAPASLHGAQAVVEAATTIHVTGDPSNGPVHVAVLRVGSHRVFAKLDHEVHSDDTPGELLAGQKVRLLVKDDGDHYFQVERTHAFDLGGLVERVRRRVRP